MSSGLKIFLTVSVVLNVLLIGMLLGGASYRMVSNPSTSSVTSNQLEAQLPEDKRKLYDATMQPALKQMEAERKEMDKAKTEALALLKAEPFDEEAYLAQVKHINELHNKLKIHMAEKVAILARQFTPRERAVLSEIISRPSSSCPADKAKAQSAQSTDSPATR